MGGKADRVAKHHESRLLIHFRPIASHEWVPSARKIPCRIWLPDPTGSWFWEGFWHEGIWIWESETT